MEILKLSMLNKNLSYLTTRKDNILTSSFINSMILATYQNDVH